ncbi:MAG: gamma-glutamyltransferase family protein [Azospirillaceae bacterium]
MFTTRPELKGSFGMIASTHWLATAVGMAMLERGGNAFDAAVAAGFVLHVAEPHMNGPGGDLPVIFQRGDADRAEVLCGQGPAPAGATIARFRELGLDIIPGTGLLPAAIPGAVDAWLVLLRDHGTMDLGEVLAPAIGYARDGFPVHQAVAAAVEQCRATFRDVWPTSGAQWLPGGEGPRAGGFFRLPALAATYQRLADAAGGSGRQAGIEAARRAWREGFVAEAIDRFCREEEILDVSGRRHRGLLTGDDLGRWQPAYEAPLTVDYHGLTVAKTRTWTQGLVFLQQLALLKGFDIAAMDPAGADFVHTVAECAKLAMADREAWYGDPDFADVPVEALLSEAYNAERRALVGADASHDFRPGAPDGRQPYLPAFLDHAEGQRRMEANLTPSDPNAGLPGGLERRDSGAMVDGDTVHLDVVDRWGNMVSATPSGGWLQSSPTIPELGFCLGTRLQMLWLDENSPSALAPGKRPRSTLTPTLVQREGRPWMALGTPGGDQQDQWTMLLFLRHLHHGLNLQEAIDLPAFHSANAPTSFWPRTRQPGVLVIEDRFDEAVFAELERRGHILERKHPWSLGRLAAVKRSEETGGTMLRAACNARYMQGYAAGR